MLECIAACRLSCETLTGPGNLLKKSSQAHHKRNATGSRTTCLRLTYGVHSVRKEQNSAYNELRNHGKPFAVCVKRLHNIYPIQNLSLTTIIQFWNHPDFVLSIDPLASN